MAVTNQEERRPREYKTRKEREDASYRCNEFVGKDIGTTKRKDSK